MKRSKSTKNTKIENLNLNEFVFKAKNQKKVKNQSEEKFSKSSNASNASKSSKSSKSSYQEEKDNTHVNINSSKTTYLTKQNEKLFPEDKKFVIKQWKLIEKMRVENLAPVDEMGCEHTAETDVPIEINRYQNLIGLMLSSQTKDEKTFAIMKKLKDYGLTPENISNISENDLSKLIYGVSFHNNKAKYIKQMTSQLINDFNSIMPNNIKDITSFPGVGSKMGNIYMSVCFGENVGIAVDTHVHRICNRLKWTNNTNAPEKTMKELEKWVPQELYSAINMLLVGFGQTICKAVKPNCEDCLLNQECEYGINQLKIRLGKKRSIKKIKGSKDETTESDFEKSELGSSKSKLKKRLSKKRIKIDLEKD